MLTSSRSLDPSPLLHADIAADIATTATTLGHRHQKPESFNSDPSFGQVYVPQRHRR
jgi:hypothetical protein